MDLQFGLDTCHCDWEVDQPERGCVLRAKRQSKKKKKQVFLNSNFYFFFYKEYLQKSIKLIEKWGLVFSISYILSNHITCVIVHIEMNWNWYRVG